MPAAHRGPPKPTDSEVAEQLGPRLRLWNELRKHLAERFPPLDEEWTFSSQKLGWSLRTRQKKRPVVYLKLCDGYFRVSLALNERAVEMARASRLPTTVLALIDDAEVFSEGRAVRLDIRSAADVRTALALAAVRMAPWFEPDRSPGA